jgi:hypothetical protein
MLEAGYVVELLALPFDKKHKDVVDILLLLKGRRCK